MRYLALASDYDGTLAHDGVVAPSVIAAIERLKDTGRKVILVTGRELADLQHVFDKLELFERVVAENGALLYDPKTHESRSLAKRPPDEFIDRLQQRGVRELSVGESIVATWHEYKQTVLDTIEESGLELQVIFNKGAVMILPSGLNKMTGLTSVLEELRLSHHNVVGIGDAENDHAFLSCCECGVAVANAIPAIKERADFVTLADHGDGVIELVEKIIDDDLSFLNPRLHLRHGILLGKADDEQILLPPYGENVLVCGQSGSGKSTLVAGFLERLIEKQYQVCLIDPEGDYGQMPGCVNIGDEKTAPSEDQLAQVLEKPQTSVVVNLVAVPMKDRPAVFSSLLTVIQGKRMHTGRPHWIVADEIHHMLPKEWAPGTAELASQLGNTLMITVHPEHVAPSVLESIGTVIAVGRAPGEVIHEFSKVVGESSPALSDEDLPPGEALIWYREQNKVISHVKVEPPRGQYSRHKRKYAQGELGAERSFYFRGSKNKLNLRAQNLSMFMQLAEGVDDETWLFHLQRGDYSDWFRNGVKDANLADEVAAFEKDESQAAAESRDRVKKAIESKYTAPA